MVATGANGHKKRVDNGSEESVSALIRHVLIGVGAALALSVALIFFGSVIAYSTADPDRLTSPLSYGALYVSACCAGLVSIRLHRKEVLLCGGLSGGILTLLFFLASLMLRGTVSDSLSPLWVAVLRLMTVLASLLGAYLGAPRGGKGSGRKKGRRRPSRSAS